MLLYLGALTVIIAKVLCDLNLVQIGHVCNLSSKNSVVNYPPYFAKMLTHVHLLFGVVLIYQEPLRIEVTLKVRETISDLNIQSGTA